MDNKGFTLIELLATVVILGLVMGIGAYGMTNTINNAKKKSETIFIEKLDEFIEEYIEYLKLENDSLNEIVGGETFTFQKCSLSNCYNLNAKQFESIKVSQLKNSSLFDKEALINPANKLDCFVGIDPEIKVFRDDDYMYYYYLDLGNGNNTCEISSDNLIINTLPDDLKTKVAGNL